MNKLNNWANIESLFSEFEQLCIKKQKTEFKSDLTKDDVNSMLTNAHKPLLSKNLLLALISGECGFYASALDSFFRSYDYDSEVLVAKDSNKKCLHYFLKVTGDFGVRYVDGAGIFENQDEILGRYTDKTDSIHLVCQDTNEREYEAFTDTYSWAIDMCESESLIRDSDCGEFMVCAFNPKEETHYCEIYDIFSIYAVHSVLTQK
ncbi:hypothetical protein [Vibrio owensii]|uniref:hypothetical protein n=1 Tax=Vibrio owensii TaxID=696485 RepID=UPI0018F1BCE3|nr:hypothetical protein [Vibrio owensii]